MVDIINHIVELNNNPNAQEDDIDHLGSRRVRYVGEMMAQKIRTGMMQMKRNIQDKMSVIDTDTTFLSLSSTSDRFRLVSRNSSRPTSFLSS
jgi:DNA-directed RNA polymerase beta subunit